MATRRLVRDPLILEIAAAIGAGRITMGPIHDDDTFVHGVIDGAGAVRINPAVDTVDTACHEMIHRLRPAWSETSVRRRTTRIMRQLSDDEIDRLYEIVLTRARLSKRAAIL